MKWLKQHWRTIAKTVGILAILTSLVLGFFWFYWMAPVKNVIDHRWENRHSERVCWEERQKSIRRWGWTHDDGFWAGIYGDKEFMTWAMEHTAPDEEIAYCVGSHRVGGFASITNQYPGETAKEWLDWWEKNKSKSQIEWIQEGFAQHDIIVHVPPSVDDTIPLLKLLGSFVIQDEKEEQETQGEQTDEEKESEEPQIPGHFRNNALRWLRNSNFNPVRFALDNDVKRLDPLVKKGLVYYSEWWMRQVDEETVGRLYFNGKPDPEDDFNLPEIFTLEGQLIVHSIIFGPLLVGLGLIILAYRKPRKSRVKLDENL